MKGRIESFSFESRCLSGNRLGDPSVREVFVYLPPAYDQGGRFPIVMMLPGFGSTHRSLLAYSPWEPTPIERFDALVASGASAPAILVLPDGMTRWGGSQYIDSPATGAYQTYLADEVISAVDARYRTLPSREGRAVVGKSSGGFGALRLGLDRPDRFAAIGSHAGDAAFEISLRPFLPTAATIFERAGGLGSFARSVVRAGPRSGPEWDALFVLAAAAAYAPDLHGEEPFCVLPFDPATAELDPMIWARYVAHDPLARVRTSPDGLASMRLVYLDAGDRDEHGLHFAARLLAGALRDANVPVHHEEFEGGHRGTAFRYEVSLPRLVEVLAREG